VTSTGESTVRGATARLADAGVPNAAHDARVLVDYARSAAVGLEPLLTARAERVPLQHLVGSTGFRYLDIAVGPGVFIPRPETELLVDAVLAAIDGSTSPVVVDLCAGSGAIGLSVALEFPGAVVHLVERSDAAYEWLVRNADDRNQPADSSRSGRARFGDRVLLHHADLADAPLGLDGLVDVVVANPPYIPLDEQEQVEPEVRDHDPAEALWAGKDGLAVIPRVIDRAAQLLRPGGRLVVEHSERHDKAVPALMTDAGFVSVAGHPDLGGRPRFTVGELPC
jgi:release factor glutamine methyltransferase